METLGPLLFILVLSLVTAVIVVRSENKYHQLSQRAKDQLANRIDPTINWEEFERVEKEKLEKDSLQADTN